MNIDKKIIDAMYEAYDFENSDLIEINQLSSLPTNDEEDALGHIWEMDWEESERPHPGFGGSTNIYGGYVSRCAKCNLYFYDVYNNKEFIKCRKV